jgi:UDP-N-acetylmuramate dehydrogenase
MKNSIRQILASLKGEAASFRVDIRYDEPMSAHTTFKTGGPADCWVRPAGKDFPEVSARLLAAAGREAIPVFILGGGANLLVSDRGIRGIVLDTGLWSGVGETEFLSEGKKVSVRILSGTSVDSFTEELARRSLSGLEFLAGMPGSAGGAVWMNARCYERSISDTLPETEILDEDHNRVIVPFRPDDFSYKKSPFQNRRVLILSARFVLSLRTQEDIRREMDEHRRDRKEKGHYRFPSAGSVFKNNRAFGSPTGKIIDELGLRGLRSGGAQVAPWHGNIIVNTGGATSTDIRSLIEKISRRVKEERGFELENEVCFSGEWD